MENQPSSRQQLKSRMLQALATGFESSYGMELKCLRHSWRGLQGLPVSGDWQAEGLRVEGESRPSWDAEQAYIRVMASCTAQGTRAPRPSRHL